MKRSLRKAMRVTGVLLLLCLIALAAFFVWAWRASRKVPDFYAAALLAPEEELTQSGEALVQDLQQLRDDVHREGTWQVVLTEQEINGWLAIQLPRRFPDLLPPQLSDPRLDIDATRVRLAARYTGKRLESVLYLSASIDTREGDNVIALTLLEAHAGLLPVPVQSVTKYVDRAAAKLKVEIEWEEDEQGRPVAVFTVPMPESTRKLDVRIDEVVLQTEQIVAYGRTRRIDSFLDWLNESRQQKPSSD